MAWILLTTKRTNSKLTTDRQKIIISKKFESVQPLCKSSGTARPATVYGLFYSSDRHWPPWSRLGAILLLSATCLQENYTDEIWAWRSRSRTAQTPAGEFPIAPEKISRGQSRLSVTTRCSIEAVSNVAAVPMFATLLFIFQRRTEWKPPASGATKLLLGCRHPTLWSSQHDFFIRLDIASNFARWFSIVINM
jgi:hypothetical protein